ncbi:MAG: ankyrin repeat domain-containing protein [Verrucomicrobia bacterium]|nr:ankyrin repeat domain-containing protein [Verrucomicrobiota bacterium]
MFLAVHTGDTILVDALIKAGARLNMTNEFHSNPLTAVCGSPRCTREMVDLLIERGADPKLRVGPRQTTALHSAAVQGNPEIIHHLIEAGVDVNAKTTDGFTALHFAHEQNKTAAIELLKNSGATE